MKIFDTIFAERVTPHGSQSVRNRLDLIPQYRDETIRTEIFFRSSVLRFDRSLLPRILI